LAYSEFYERRDKYRLNFLQKPFDDKELIGLVRKLLMTKQIPQQLYKRFRTNQLASIENLADGSRLDSNMYNLSKGGVYCEFSAEPRFAVGDVVRMKVPFGN
jgi:hypothetical protein